MKLITRIKNGINGLLLKNVGRIIPSYYTNFYSNQWGLPAPGDFYNMVQAYKSWVYICASRNAINVAQVPLKLYVSKKKNSKKLLVQTKEVKKEVKDFIFSSPNLNLIECVRKGVDIEEVVEHPFLNLLRNVNSFTNRFDLLEATELYLELIGNSYWYVIKNNFGIPSEIWVVPGHFMSVVPDKEKFIKGYAYRNGLEIVPFDEKEIIHFKFTGTDMFYGKSPLSAILNAFNKEENIDRYADALFRNMGTPEGILTTEQDLSEEAFERIRDTWKQTYGGVGNAGKGHPYGTPILTSSGWKLIENLEIGDELFSQDGSVTHLKGKFSRGEQQCYKFTFDDKTTIECDEEHLWDIQNTFLRTRKVGRNKKLNPSYGKYYTISTKEIFKHYNSGNLNPRARYWIPVVKPLQFPKKEVPVDPYVLGCVLGDGWILEFNRKNGGSPDRRAFMSVFEQEILDNMDVKYNPCTNKGQYGISGVALPLCKLGLGGKKAYDKFIPEIYLYNDIETRLEVLRGLLDCDGCITSRDKNVVFTTISPSLRDGLMFLVRSLGGRASFSSIPPGKATFNGKSYPTQRAYYVSIRINNFIPFKLKRKADLVRASVHTFNRKIMSVEAIGIKETICLSVEHESGLYVAKDCIVTHNTAILTNGLDYKPISFKPREIGFLISKKMTIAEIAAAYGIPMSKLTSEDVNLANAYIGERVYQKDTILPRLRRIEEKLNEKLMPLYDDNLFCAYNNNIPEDRELILREREVNLRSGYITINEERAKEGLKPVEWGKVPILPSGNMPLGSAPYRSSGQVDNLAQQIATSIKDEISKKKLAKVG